jgi:streptomycin 6-kinase
VQFPHHESEHEVEALEAWDGNGAVRLVESNRADRAFLVEACRPGRHLAEVVAERALDVVADLLPRLLVPADGPFVRLVDEAARWCDQLSTHRRGGAPFEPRLIDAAVWALRELGPTQGENVLLHQDLHAANVLSAEREPWLVIDPKPLVGERAFAVAPMVRSSELGHSRKAVLRRFDRLTAEVGVDRDRARGWTIGQTVAWALGDGQVHGRQLETAGWLLDAR